MALWEEASAETSYLLDLDAPFTWLDCVMDRFEGSCMDGDRDLCYLPYRCSYSHCIDARSYTNPNCPSLNITAKYGCSICAVTPVNPLPNTCKISQLTSKFLYLSTTDGRSTFSTMANTVFWSYTVSCAPSSLKRSLPEGVRGVAAFSWSNLAFPRQ